MVAVWIILGFLAGNVSLALYAVWYLRKFTKCSSYEEASQYVYCASLAKREKNETNKPVVQEIEYEDYSEKLTLE